MAKFCKFISKQLIKHRDEFCRTWWIMRTRRTLRDSKGKKVPLKYGFLERWSLRLLTLLAFFTLVNLIVFLLRSIVYIFFRIRHPRRFKMWRFMRNDHGFVEFAVLIILGALILPHTCPDLLPEGRFWSWVLRVVIGCLIAEVITVLIRIVFQNQYREFVGWTPVSLNRSIILLILNFFEIVLSFSILYMLSESIGVDGSGGRFPLCPGQSIYFSIVTITTLGYGDFYPIGSSGQWLVSIEVMVGFIFVVLIISQFIQFLSRVRTE